MAPGDAAHRAVLPHRAALPRRAVLGLLLLALATGGCVRTVSRTVVASASENPVDGSLRSASNLPAAFLVVTPARVTGDCPVRLRDTELQVLLTLVRSTVIPARDSTAAPAAWGDYELRPAGMYGDEPGEGLRVDCTRMRPLGVVPLESG